MPSIDKQNTIVADIVYKRDKSLSPSLQVHSKEVDVHSIGTELELVYCAPTGHESVNNKWSTNNSMHIRLTWRVKVGHNIQHRIVLARSASQHIVHQKFLAKCL